MPGYRMCIFDLGPKVNDQKNYYNFIIKTIILIYRLILCTRIQDVHYLAGLGIGDMPHTKGFRMQAAVGSTLKWFTDGHIYTNPAGVGIPAPLPMPMPSIMALSIFPCGTQLLQYYI